jgi:hypothetical protein
MVIFGFGQDVDSVKKMTEAIYSHKQHGEQKLPPLAYVDYSLYSEIYKSCRGKYLLNLVIFLKK